MIQRRNFFKQVGAVFAGVAAAVYCPAVLTELFEAPSPINLFDEMSKKCPQWHNITVKYKDHDDKAFTEMLEGMYNSLLRSDEVVRQGIEREVLGLGGFKMT